MPNATCPGCGAFDPGDDVCIVCHFSPGEDTPPPKPTFEHPHHPQIDVSPPEPEKKCERCGCPMIDTPEYTNIPDDATSSTLCAGCAYGIFNA